MSAAVLGQPPLADMKEGGNGKGRTESGYASKQGTIIQQSWASLNESGFDILGRVTI